MSTERDFAIIMAKTLPLDLLIKQTIETLQKDLQKRPVSLSDNSKAILGLLSMRMLTENKTVEEAIKDAKDIERRQNFFEPNKN